MSTETEIAGLNPLTAGPTADTSGMLGWVFSGSWTNHPVGKVVENPNLSLEYFWRKGDFSILPRPTLTIALLFKAMSQFFNDYNNKAN